MLGILLFAFGNFLGMGPFRDQLRENPQTIGARNKRPDSKRKRTGNFSVRKILLFLAHLKSPVPATVGKNFASIFIPTELLDLKLVNQPLFCNSLGIDCVIYIVQDNIDC